MLVVQSEKQELTQLRQEQLLPDYSMKSSASQAVTAGDINGYAYWHFRGHIYGSRYNDR
jgi:hypothetical protein